MTNFQQENLLNILLKKAIEYNFSSEEKNELCQHWEKKIKQSLCYITGILACIMYLDYVEVLIIFSYFH